VCVCAFMCIAADKRALEIGLWLSLSSWPQNKNFYFNFLMTSLRGQTLFIADSHIAILV